MLGEAPRPQLGGRATWATKMPGSCVELHCSSMVQGRRRALVSKRNIDAVKRVTTAGPKEALQRETWDKAAATYVSNDWRLNRMMHIPVDASWTDGIWGLNIPPRRCLGPSLLAFRMLPGAKGSIMESGDGLCASRWGAQNGKWVKESCVKLTWGHWELYLPYRLEELRSVLTQPCWKAEDITVGRN